MLDAGHIQKGLGLLSVCQAAPACV